MTMMTAFSARSYKLSCLLKLSNKCACEYLIFFGYDVRFVDVVKFDYRNFQFLSDFCANTRLCFYVYFNYANNQYISVCVQFCLILADATAIGIRLSHASRTSLDSWRTAQ